MAIKSKTSLVYKKREKGREGEREGGGEGEREEEGRRGRERGGGGGRGGKLTTKKYFVFK